MNKFDSKEIWGVLEDPEQKDVERRILKKRLADKLCDILKNTNLEVFNNFKEVLVIRNKNVSIIIDPFDELQEVRSGSYAIMAAMEALDKTCYDLDGALKEYYK